MRWDHVSCRRSKQLKYNYNINVSQNTNLCWDESDECEIFLQSYWSVIFNVSYILYIVVETDMSQNQDLWSSSWRIV